MTSLHRLLAEELAGLRARLGRDTLRICETGSIRGDSVAYAEGDGWSTVLFAEEVRAHGGSVVSIDLDVSVAVQVLAARDLDRYVTLVEGHSLDVLDQMLFSDPVELVDVLFLDSDNDADLILREFLIGRRLLRAGGLLLVDDVDMDSDGVVKGHQLVPWLDEHGVGYRIAVRTGPAYTTGVLIAGGSLD